MAVTLEYTSLSTFSDVMREEDQARASDDATGTDPNTDPVRDDALVERFLKRAESMADSYLVRYDRPLDNVPAALEWAIYVIARYMLLERSDGSVSDDMKRSYEEAMDWLKMVREEKVDLAPAQDEDLEDFVGLGEYDQMTFAEYPFVDKSAFATGDPY